MTIKLITGKPNKKRQSVIYLQYIHAQKRLLFSTKLQINTELHWDSKLSRVKKSHPDSILLNEILQKEISKINQLVLHCRTQNIDPTTTVIRSVNKKSNNKEIETSFFMCFSSFLEEYSVNRTKSTISIYNNLLNYLKSFSEDTQTKLEWIDINYNFMERFSSHLFRNKLASSTVRRNISYLKSFLNHAFKKGLLKSKEYESHKAVKVPKKDVISLTEVELEKIRTVKLNGSLSKVRDVFCFSSMTGLRFSDISNVKKEAVEITKSGAILKLTTQKTKTLTTVPLLPQALEILSKWKYQLVTVSIQRYLHQVKFISKLAGIDQLVRVIEYRGSERIEKLVPKYLLIGSHTARRTFINLSLLKNIPINLVASVSHGGNINSLMKYLNIDETHKQKVFTEAWAKKK